MHQLSTTLLQLLSITIFCLHVLGDSPKRQFDYIIVGGGNAGLTVASRLTEDPSISVAIIEAGDFYEHATGNQSQIPANDAFYNGKSANATNPLVEWGFMTTPQAGIDGDSLHYARGKTLGGCTALNYMGYQRTTAGALQRWAEDVGDDSWAYENVSRFYEKSSNFTPPDADKRIANATPEYDLQTLGTGGPLDVTYPNYAQPFSTWVARAMEDAGMPHIDGFTSGYLNGSGWLVNTINQTTGFRESSEAAFLRPFLSRPNLFLYRKTLAEQILFEGNTATGVRASGDGPSFDLAARKEVILSAGVFQSPQLLLVSGIGPAEKLRKHGIKMIANRRGVGQGMNDHVFFGIAYKVDVQTNSVLSDPAARRQAVEEFKSEQAGPLSSPGGDYASYESLPAEYRASFSPNTLARLSEFPEDWLELEYFSLPAYVGDFEFPGKGGPTDGMYATIMVTLIAPTSRGSVSISSSSMHDQPLINPNWLTTETDVEVAIAAFRRLRQIFGSPVMEENLTLGPEYYPGNSVQTNEEIHEWIKTAFQTMYHATSTCKMGRRHDPFAVVDTKGRVYGANNLRVVDASAFPFLPPGLPMGTVYMLAEKIAEDIKEEHYYRI